MERTVVVRSTPKRSKRWQQPGYVAVVEHPEEAKSPLEYPLTAACLRKHGARIVWSTDVRDLRYDGPRSSYGDALRRADEIVSRHYQTSEDGR